MNEEAILKVAGKAYYGWTGVAIEKSMYQMAGSFGLVTTDIFPNQAKKWNITLGDECIVSINDQSLVTGYVEDILIDYSKDSHNIQIGGRDKTGDLVDCSFDGTVNEWKGLPLISIIDRLCAPFDIEIKIDSSLSSISNAPVSKWVDNFKANEGDTVFDLIKSACSMVGILPISYGDGKLTLTRAGKTYKANDILESGKNILAGNLDQSNKDRFQYYIVKGQGVGEDDKTSWEASSPVGRALDNVIKRYRPMIILAATKCDEGKCIEMAKWELNNRAGASRKLSYDVQGWTQSNGEIWPLNAMVQIKDKVLGINSSLLISSLNFAINESGTITKMTVVDPDTFTVLPKSIKTESDWPR